MRLNNLPDCVAYRHLLRDERLESLSRDVEAVEACELCGGNAAPLRMCGECLRNYCPDCAGGGRCDLCRLYKSPTVTRDKHGRYWIFEGRIAGTTIDVHTAHPYQLMVLARARQIAWDLMRERAAESSNEGESGRRPVG